MSEEKPKLIHKLIADKNAGKFAYRSSGYVLEQAQRIVTLAIEAEKERGNGWEVVQRELQHNVNTDEGGDIVGWIEANIIRILADTYVKLPDDGNITNIRCRHERQEET